MNPIALIRIGTLMRQGRIDLQRAQGLNQPVGIDGDRLPRPARGELIVAAEIDRRRLVALDPEPEELIVAAQVNLRPGEPGFGPEAEVALSLKGEVGPQSRKTRSVESGRIAEQGLDLRVVAIDRRDHLFQSRPGRKHLRTAVPARRCSQASHPVRRASPVPAPTEDVETCFRASNAKTSLRARVESVDPSTPSVLRT